MFQFNEGRVEAVFLETASFRLTLTFSHHYLLHRRCAHYQYQYHHVAPLPHLNSSQNFKIFIDIYG